MEKEGEDASQETETTIMQHVYRHIILLRGMRDAANDEYYDGECILV